jgi:DNA-binding PadR family transcriptional regulator
MESEMHGHGCGGERHERRFARGGRWGFDPRSWGAWEGGRGGQGGRVLAQGDLKFLVLHLIKEKPRHGYEIIKAIEESFGGAYAPSPGTVYPTLSMLEDLGYIRALPEEGGRKSFAITPEGTAHLAENQATVDALLQRVAGAAADHANPSMVEVHRAMKNVGRAVYMRFGRHDWTPEQIARVRDILDRAASDIDQV